MFQPAGNAWKKQPSFLQLDCAICWSKVRTTAFKTTRIRHLFSYITCFIHFYINTIIYGTWFVFFLINIASHTLHMRGTRSLGGANKWRNNGRWCHQHVVSANAFRVVRFAGEQRSDPSYGKTFNPNSVNMQIWCDSSDLFATVFGALITTCKKCCYL